jgi:hypothetical protein
MTDIWNGFPPEPENSDWYWLQANHEQAQPILVRWISASSEYRDLAFGVDISANKAAADFTYLGRCTPPQTGGQDQPHE